MVFCREVLFFEDAPFAFAYASNKFRKRIAGCSPAKPICPPSAISDANAEAAAAVRFAEGRANFLAVIADMHDKAPR